jgi:acetyl esterase/lipase
MRRLLPCLLALALCACTSVQPLYFGALNHDVPIVPVHTFVYDQQHAQSLDVYPARNASGPAPVVLFFYGGTWRDGRREYYRFVGESLSRHGVLAIVADYRKAPANVFPAFMEDAASAAAWTKAHAAQLGGDPDRIHLMGHSAGAHMVALLAADPRYLARVGLHPRDFASVIGLSGAYDFLPITEVKVKRVFPDRASWPQTQPVNFVDGDEPPFLLLHGASDRRVWTENSVRMADRLRAAGVPATLEIAKKTGHIAMVNGFRSPRFSPVLADTLAWINGGESEAIAAARKKTASPTAATPSN